MIHGPIEPRGQPVLSVIDPDRNGNGPRFITLRRKNRLGFRGFRFHIDCSNSVFIDVDRSPIRMGNPEIGVLRVGVQLHHGIV